MCLDEEADMSRTLACVAILVAGSGMGCSKARYTQPAEVGYETEPRGHSTATAKAQMAKGEEPAMTPASGTTMTPASGTTAPVAGAEPGPELAVGSRGPVILQDDAAEELSAGVCQHQASCGEGAVGECERTVKEASLEALAGCDHGLSRTELYVCLTAISEKACGTDVTALAECSASSLCLP